jgi:membrane-bound lytic murein transglycosylase B
MELTETVASLSQLGYIFSSELPNTAATTILSVQGEDEQEYWVGYHNFRVITRYNRSVKYALAAHDLGQAVLAAYSQLQAETRTEYTGA